MAKDLAREISDRESFGELLSRLTNTISGLVRDQIDLAKQEFKEKSRALRAGIIGIAIGAAIGFFALMSLCAALIIGLSTFMKPGWAALIVGIALIIVSAIFVMFGMQKIKRTSLKPEETIHSLRQDLRLLKPEPGGTRNG
jgi:uncharacterized membrane protein YqjE